MNNTEIKPIGYGYAEEQVQRNFGQFGLNENVRLVGFNYLPTTGKNNDQGEALEVKLLFPGTDEPTTHLIYPVSKLNFREDNGTEVELNSPSDCNTDAKRKAWNTSVNHVNNVISSFLRCYKTANEVKAAFAVPFKGFKGFIEVAQRILPVNYDKIDLDLFMQYKWNSNQKIDENGENTGEETLYLEIPKKPVGEFICKHVEPKGGPWQLVKKNPDEVENNTTDALKFVDGEGNIHPIRRTGFFIKSNWAKNLKERNGEFIDNGTLNVVIAQAEENNSEGEW